MMVIHSSFVFLLCWIVRWRIVGMGSLGTGRGNNDGSSFKSSSTRSLGDSTLARVPRRIGRNVFCIFRKILWVCSVFWSDWIAFISALISCVGLCDIWICSVLRSWTSLFIIKAKCFTAASYRCWRISTLSVPLSWMWRVFVLKGSASRWLSCARARRILQYRFVAPALARAGDHFDCSFLAFLVLVRRKWISLQSCCSVFPTSWSLEWCEADSDVFAIFHEVCVSERTFFVYPTP